MTKEKDTKVLTGLAKRDKERTKKIIEKYKTCPNMEATKQKCVLGCPQKFLYWGNLRFCELLLDLDTIQERKCLCFDKNICWLCLCLGIDKMCVEQVSFVPGALVTGTDPT